MQRKLPILHRVSISGHDIATKCAVKSGLERTEVLTIQVDLSQHSPVAHTAIGVNKQVVALQHLLSQACSERANQITFTVLQIYPERGDLLNCLINVWYSWL